MKHEHTSAVFGNKPHSKSQFEAVLQHSYHTDSLSFRKNQSTKSLIRRSRAAAATAAALAQIGEVKVGDGVVQQDAIAGHHLEDNIISVNIDLGWNTILNLFGKGFLRSFNLVFLIDYEGLMTITSFSS